MAKKKAVINQKECVACGACIKVCPKAALSIFHGLYAKIEKDKCIGCGKCEKTCPAGVIERRESGE